MLAGGELVAPRWVAQVRDSQGVSLDRTSDEATERTSAWGPDFAAELRGLLRGVIDSGTARRAFHDADGVPRLGPVSVSGKTGTLRGENPEGLYQWFMGVAPATDPRIAIAALVVHSGERGASASELAAASLADVFCDVDGTCGAELAERLSGRAASRDAQAARGRRELVANAQRANLTLDEPPRPAGGVQLQLPRRLRLHPIRGEVVLRLDLDSTGAIEDTAVESTDLPQDFTAFVKEAVSGWAFTPPRRRGRPVSAQVRVPIPIRVD